MACTPALCGFLAEELQLAISLDGLIEGPNGEYDWCFTDPEEDYGMADFLQRIDAIFYGRKSYELAAAFAATPEGQAMAANYPKFKEYVFSTTLTNAPENVEIVSSNIAEEVKRIKSEPGKDIWLYGGASLTTALMHLNLVDELMLAVHPIILGKGKSLFAELNSRFPLKHLETKTYSSGLVMLTYGIET